MPKREYNKIKSLTPKQILEKYNEPEDGYVGIYEIVTNVYEFGKYVDFLKDKKTYKPFWKNKESKKRYEHYQPNVVTKEFLALIIKDYTELVKKYYLEMLDGIDTRKPETLTLEKSVAMWQHIRSFSSEWNDLIPYNLEHGEQITTSWKFEYGIFELVRIYKTFAWKKDVLVYYGY